MFFTSLREWDQIAKGASGGTGASFDKFFGITGRPDVINWRTVTVHLRQNSDFAALGSVGVLTHYTRNEYWKWAVANGFGRPPKDDP